MARILVVDDESLVRRAMTRILTTEGYSVVTAGDGEEALRYAGDTVFDLAIVDYDMPGRDGLWVLSALRELMPGCIRVLMTGRTDFPIVVEAVNRGEVLRVIQKPFEPTRIRALVGEAFGAIERMQAVREAQQRAVAASERSMMERGLASDHFQLAVQPIVRAGSGSVYGFESLLRSTHAVLDGPLPILKVAEESGLLDELGNLVARRAADILTVIPHHTVLFVNLHPAQLADRRLLSHTLSPLVPYARRCAIEITERSRLKDIHQWEHAVDALQEAGFPIAVDDLGAGYNALSILADLQPRYIKIDMSITRNVDAEPRKQRLVDLLCKFGEATGASVIAEGVETAGEAETLVEVGAHLLQGYYFGRPSLDIASALRAAG